MYVLTVVCTTERVSILSLYIICVCGGGYVCAGCEYEVHIHLLVHTHRKDQ